MDLCENTSVDGVQGEVWQLDLTRNPGSARAGKDVSEKKVSGIYRNCYATSCDIPLLKEREERLWHSADATLSIGEVSIRPVGHSEEHGRDWMSIGKWVLGALCAAIVTVAALICCFMKAPKRERKTRGHQWHPKSSPREPFQHHEQKVLNFRGMKDANVNDRRLFDDDSNSDDDRPPPTPPPPPGQQWRTWGAPAGPQSLPSIDPDHPYHRHLLVQAQHMKAVISQAGAHAVQNMKMTGLHGMHQSVIESMRPPFATFPTGPPQYQLLNSVPAPPGSSPGSPTTFAFPSSSSTFGPHSPASSLAYSPLTQEGFPVVG